MSSTTLDRGRDPLGDFYRTPAWCVQRLYEEVLTLPPTLDPCAGDGALLGAFCHDSWPLRGIELHPGRAAAARAAGLDVTTGDGLAASWAGEDVLMNPPFANAPAWIDKGLREAKSMVCLLRLGYLAGQKRKRVLWDMHPPLMVVVMSARPFPDSADYCWVVWDSMRWPTLCREREPSVRWITR